MSERICIVDGCEGSADVPGTARGYCRPHYNRWQRYGDPLAGKPPRPRKVPGLPKGASAADRFWSKVEKTDTCWLWLGALDTQGYGQFHADGRRHKAHRFAWRLAGRSLDGALVLDHMCRTRRCVRPDHLEQVANKTNVLRGVGAAAMNARKTHCPSGHPYDEDNTYVYIWRGAPVRICRACRSARAKAEG